MDCDRADLVIGLLEEELDPAEKAEVEAHLQGCGACRATRDAYAATLGELRALPAERPSADAAARAYAAVVEAMASASAVGSPVAPAAAPAGKVLAFPAPRAQGRRALVIQLAAAAACLLLVVALVAPDRQARTAARAPAPADAAPEAAAAAGPRPTAAAGPLPAAPSLAKTVGEAERLAAEERKDEASDAEDEAALALRRRRAEAAEDDRFARELSRDAAAGETPPADDPAPPLAPATPATRPPSATPGPTPPGAAPGAGNDAGGVAPAGRGGSTEPLGEPDGDTQAGRSRGAPPAPPPPAPPRAPAEVEAGALAQEPTSAHLVRQASDALGAWRTTLEGEPLDVALLPGAAGGPPRLVVVRRTAAAFSDDRANSRSAARAADEVQLLDGAAASPDLARALDRGDEEGAKVELDDAAKARPTGVDEAARTRRLLLVLLTHEVAQDSPTASQAEAVAIARAQRVAALLAALDGRPLDAASAGDQVRRQTLLRQARERVERDVPTPARSAR